MNDPRSLPCDTDKLRVLEGLEGVAVSSGGSFNRSTIDKLLSGLGKRIFLLHNVNKSAPETFEARWALSYLRGPLTRDQIRVLMAPVKATMPAAAPAAAAAGQPAALQGRPLGVAATSSALPDASTARPVLPPTISQFFAPAKVRGPLAYSPMLYGAAEMYFTNEKYAVDVKKDVSFMAPIQDGAVAVDWDSAEATDLSADALRSEPTANAVFTSLPASAARPQSYAAWKAEFGRWLQRTQTIELMRSRKLGVVSQPDETERDFRLRLGQAAREHRDEFKETLRKKYEPKLSALEERKRKAEQVVEREKSQADQSKLQTALSVGAGIFTALLGGGRTGARSTLGRATTAARGVGRTMKESSDIGRAKETVAAVDEQLKALQAGFEAEVEAASSAADALTEQFDKVILKPKATGVSVKVLSLVWSPS